MTSTARESAGAQGGPEGAIPAASATAGRFSDWLRTELQERLFLIGLGTAFGAISSLLIRPEAWAPLGLLAIFGGSIAAIPRTWRQQISLGLTPIYATVALSCVMLLPAPSRLLVGLLMAIMLPVLLPVPRLPRLGQVISQGLLLTTLTLTEPLTTVSTIIAMALAWGFGEIQLRHWQKQRRDHDELAHLTERLARESDRRSQAIRQRELELLDQQERMVQQAQWATLGRVAVGVGHEIKNPLQAAMSDVETAQREGDLSVLADAMRSMERIRAILTDLSLLRGSKAERVDIYPLDEMLSSTLRGAGIGLPNLRVRTERIPDMAVYANQGRLIQVVANLLTNAWHATERRGWGQVRVHSAVHGDEILLYFDDDGPGIRPDLRDRVFEAFVTSKKAGQGSGLGLPISRSLLQAMGGDLRAEGGSKLGGARMVMSLRLAPQDAPRQSVQTPASPARTQRPPAAGPRSEQPQGRVLVIDDDPGTLRAVARALQRSWSVRTASGSREARAALREATFDVVLSDLHLVQEDAVDVIGMVQRVAPTLVDSIVFMSGEPTSGRLVSLALANPDRLIRKPFDREAVLQLLGDARGQSLPPLEVPDDDLTPEPMAVLEPAWQIEPPTEEYPLPRNRDSDEVT